MTGTGGAGESRGRVFSQRKDEVMWSKRIAVVALLAAMAVSAWAGLGPLTPFDNVAIRTATPEAAQQAIERGAANGKWPWKTDVKSPELVRCTFDHRKYQVVVDVVHGPDTISVKYHSSVNMRYDPLSKTINTSYNKWVTQLVKDIQKAALELPPPPQPQPQPQPDPDPEPPEERIRKLFELRDAGLITDAECDERRREILESL